MKYDIIIGLEIHAELSTKSKMFCSCPNDSEEKEPNINTCPICLAHPGTTVLANQEAIDRILRLGLALGSKINKLAKFSRKHYYYPDLPKGYQISQDELAFCIGGELDIGPKNIPIKRIHLEEDAAKSYKGKDASSLINYNRAGAPLIELVTDPIIQDAKEAKDFCQNYQRVLRYLNISQANMENGEMRCEANISLQTPGSWELVGGEILAKENQKLNPKVELKNINSFRALERAINYEIEYQANILDNGGQIISETKTWDEKKGKNISMRKKGPATNYRFLDDPDLPVIITSDEKLEALRQSIPELAMAKQKRLMKQYFLSEEDANLISEKMLIADFFEKVVSELGAWFKASGTDFNKHEKEAAQLTANWFNTRLQELIRQDKKEKLELRFSAENMAELINLLWHKKINSNTGQKLLSIMYESGGDPSDLIRDLGLEQIDNESELEDIIKSILDSHQKQVSEYKAGKLAIFEFFLGQVMARTKGKAAIDKSRAILNKLLK